MMSTTIEIIDPGLLSTVQDLGRHRVAALGVSPSGASDWLSARCANRLLGNPHNAALVETTLTGIRFAPRHTTMIAITGADAPVSIAGAQRPTWQALRVRAGVEVKIGHAQRGVRCYVAFHGGIDVPLVLGSASTDVMGGFGGAGRALATGDTLALAQVERELPDDERAIPASARPFWRQPAVLRVLPGPHFARCAPHEIETLCGQAYRVSARSNRQGARLEGVALRNVGGFDVLSSGVTAGCVQLTSDGLPIVLLAEHQTTGGYAVPFVVIAADVPDAAQLRPGDSVRFSRVTLADASAALTEKTQALREEFDEPAAAR
ncbi:MAG: biotin-dependent carboxyltransferase family protein [Candidatus Eremiobacteraeota bacterium]|nr:biotin-dependent carboxyltransferase family protein [Candidatus Eremiobacteraeota bacterium]MBV8339716.1 biotin-dependent carboxyltransferase family protein [Candidatus Eremiobacteraeota bacterium]MBV8460653.1 biotin-dependent carboxyltransferase family protein [Candidatus Eremiobacteraeota bacterium]MBV8596475.1 biotin-dependent carboxyltransferase family protein [Candidatus Eremiobacteraeota bacterium]